MGHAYKAVQWTPFKKSYDVTLALGILAYLVSFIVVTHLALAPGQAMTEI